jgi:hypothetical protein
MVPGTKSTLPVRVVYCSSSSAELFVPGSMIQIQALGEGRWLEMKRQEVSRTICVSPPVLRGPEQNWILTELGPGADAIDG